MMLKTAYVALLGAIPLLILVGWILAKPEKLPKLSAWRLLVLRIGLIGNATSMILFLATILHVLNAPTNIETNRILFGVAIVPVFLGAFGRRAPRVIVILNGLSLTFLWLDLGASSM
jgi:hypothetical protein